MVIDGKVGVRKVCDFGINLDERIADGFYFTKSLEYFRYVLEHPELLEENANVAKKKKKIKIDTPIRVPIFLYYQILLVLPCHL